MLVAQEQEKRTGRPAQVPPLAVFPAGGSSPSHSQSGSAAGSSTAGSAGGFATLETLRQQFSLRPQARSTCPVDSLAETALRSYTSRTANILFSMFYFCITDLTL